MRDAFVLSFEEDGSLFSFLGSFGDAISPAFELQEFIDEKPAYYAFANETKTLTKAEGYALLEKYLGRP